jgi:hypothetical protein
VFGELEAAGSMDIVAIVIGFVFIEYGGCGCGCDETELLD